MASKLSSTIVPGKDATTRRKRVEGAAQHLEPAKSATSKNTKSELILKKLRSAKGASIEMLIAETGWQAHSVRGAISGALKKKLCLAVSSEKVEDRGRVYRIANHT